MSEDLEKTIQSQGASFVDSEATIRDVTPLARRRLKAGDLLLARYEVLSELGQGGMGVVYRCLDRTGGTEVAVKALPPELSHSPAEMEEVRENYKLVSGLFHPNIAACRTLDMDPATGDYYLVMEYVEGEQLKMWMQRTHPDGKVPLKETISLLRQVAEALDYAHQRKIMHRDIKPTNIMVQADGTVKVLDFGLAAQIQSSMSRVSSVITSQSGTRQYKSPEQWQGQAQGASSDQYALAATAYEMLSGHVPFDDNDAAVLREMVLKENPAWIKGVASYANLALSHGLAKTSSERYASCLDFIRALGGEKVDLNGGGKSTSGLGKFAAVLAVVIGLVIAGMAYHRYVGTSRSDVAEKTDEELRAESEKKAAEELASRKQHAEDEKWLREHRVSLKVEVDALTEKVRELKNNIDAEVGKQFDAFENYLKLAIAAGAEDPGIAVENYEAARKEAERLLENIPFLKSAEERMKAVEMIKNEALKYHAEQHARDAFYFGARKESEGKKEYEDGLYKAALKSFETAMSSYMAAQKYAKEMQLAEINKNLPQIPDSLKVNLANDVILELVKVEAGSFMMGDTQNETEKQPWEKPHQVTLTNDFWLGKYEVTQSQYEAIMKNNPSVICKGENYPVENVSWKNAISFCRLLTQRERAAGRLPDGYEYTLPTEAQWEFAARGGKKSNGYLYSGGNDYDEVAWLHKNAGQVTHPVGQKHPNELGFYDMSGNVEEWCRDWYEDDYAKDCEFLYQNKGKQHVMRGGHIHAFFPLYSRTSGRMERYPVDFGMHTGFRVSLVYNPSLKFASTLGDSMVVVLPDGVLLEMVKVKAGSFMMGSPENEEGRKDDEKLHRVSLTNDYWIGKYEVTQGQWKAVMGDNPSSFKKGDNYPVEMVNWHDAMEFCKKLTERERSEGRLPVGYEFTLPTEAQWEYACRAETNTPFNFGLTLNGDNANCNGNFPYGMTAKGINLVCTSPVGSYAPNAWGLYDMHGNVWEWCRDWYGDYPTSLDVDPIGPSLGSYHLLRGGSWNSYARYCRSAIRYDYDSLKRIFSHGFRVAFVVASNDSSMKQEQENVLPVVPSAQQASQDATKMNGLPVNTKTIHLSNDVVLELVKVKAGSFMMGSPSSESDRSDNETQHYVTLTRDFWLGKYEVTQGQWKAVMGNNPSKFAKGDSYPVEMVSWNEAMNFCKKLTEQERSTGRLPDGYEFTLPTEAQWEYACRAGTNTPFSFGSTLNGDKANCDGNYPYGTTAKGRYLEGTSPVGRYSPNAWGLYDMHGNVWEWCRDSCEYNKSVITDTYRDGIMDPYCRSGSNRVLRGGSWRDNARYCRSAYSYDGAPSQHGIREGFRVALAPVQ